LLGTGAPGPSPNRFGPSTLVQVAGMTLLFDAGRGCTIRVSQAGLPLDIDAVFLTHFHSDHVNGLPDIWMTSYIGRRPPSANPALREARTVPMRLYGPPGTARIAGNLHAAFSDDIRMRTADEGLTQAATGIEAHEYARDGVIFNERGVTVTAFEVDHGPLVKPAYGYRIDSGGHAVLISGDTRYNENVIAHGTGVDIMVHEVCALSPEWRDNPDALASAAHNTSPEECAAVFSRTQPKFAALTHLVLIGATPDQVEARVRAGYAGRFVVGEDLMRMTILGESVTMERWNAQKSGYAG
jgi:ribonuclease Z